MRVAEEAHEARYAELVFLHPVRFGGHVVLSGASGVRKINPLFFILGWGRCRSQKTHAGTCFAELVFLHSIRSRGHVARSSASRVRNVNALFFILGWARSRSHKRHARTHCTELVFLHSV
jgi:hypothetical protein